MNHPVTAIKKHDGVGTEVFNINKVGIPHKCLCVFILIGLSDAAKQHFSIHSS